MMLTSYNPDVDKIVYGCCDEFSVGIPCSVSEHVPVKVFATDLVSLVKHTCLL